LTACALTSKRILAWLFDKAFSRKFFRSLLFLWLVCICV